MRDLCLLSDEKVCTLADDLLFHTNSFTNIDGYFSIIFIIL